MEQVSGSGYIACCVTESLRVEAFNLGTGYVLLSTCVIVRDNDPHATPSVYHVTGAVLAPFVLTEHTQVDSKISEHAVNY